MTDTLVVDAPKKKSRAEGKFDKQKSVIKSAIISATENFKKKNGYDAATPTGADDPIVVALRTELSYWRMNYNSDQSARLARMFSKITDLPITDTSPVGRGLQWVRFGAAVIVGVGVNGHNYPLNKIVVITEQQKGYREDGTIGNAMDNNHLIMRPATLEEIEKITNESYASIAREFLIM